MTRLSTLITRHENAARQVPAIADYRVVGAEGGILHESSSQYQHMLKSLQFHHFQLSECGVESSCTEEFVCV